MGSFPALDGLAPADSFGLSSLDESVAAVKRLIEQLNGPWHKRALQAFMVIVLAHWAEHLVQAYQVYELRWPLHEARGVLGQAFPWLVHSELLHYVVFVPMMIGMYYHLFPSAPDAARMHCTCSLRLHTATT
jgi:hypothetical protein